MSPRGTLRVRAKAGCGRRLAAWAVPGVDRPSGVHSAAILGWARLFSPLCRSSRTSQFLAALALSGGPCRQGPESGPGRQPSGSGLGRLAHPFPGRRRPPPQVWRL